MQYLTQWQLWFAVIVIALVTNFVYSYFTKKGKLI